MALSKNFGDNLASQLGKIERAAASTSGAIDAMGRAADRMEAAFGSVDFSRLDSIGGGGSSSKSSPGGGRSAAGDLGGSLVAGLAPLASIGTQITAQLDRVGGTVVTLARRIDDALKKPFFERLIEEATKAENRIIRVGAKAAEAGLRVRHFFTNFGDVAGKGLGQVTNLGKGFESLPAPIRSATSHVKRLGAEIALALGAFALAYKTAQAGRDFLSGGIKGAVDLNETLSKTGEVFGKSAGEIAGLADRMAGKFGAVKGEVLDAASGFGLIARGAKFSQQEAAGLAGTMTKLAADSASFFNADNATALEKIRAGLVGESEPLRAFGVLLNEDAVKAEALALKLGKGKTGLDEHAKVMARASLIAKGLAVASGDQERTASAPANAFRKFAGTLRNLATDIGTALLPAIQEGIGLLNMFARAAVAKWEASKEAFRGFVDKLVYGIGSVEIAFKNWPKVMEMAWSVARDVFANMQEALGALTQNVRLFAGYFSRKFLESINVSGEAVGGFFNFALDAFSRFGKAIGVIVEDVARVVWNPLVAGFKTAFADMPKLIRPKFKEIGADAARMWDAINKRQSKFAGGLAGIAGGVGRDAGKMLAGLMPEGEKAAGKAEPKDNAAITFGSKEAASAIAKFTNKSDTNAVLIKIQQEQLAAIRRVAAALEATRGKKGGAGDLADELNLGSI